jgi:hypothetical protein
MATSAGDLWERQLYNFHWHTNPAPLPLVLYRNHQQDSMRANWEGLVAGTDDSVDERSDHMRAGYAIGDKPVPIPIFSAPVGGPLASESIRPEEASLIQILRDVAANHDNRTPLLIFVDCLVLLDILSKWGCYKFHPSPKDTVHFDIIPCPHCGSHVNETFTHFTSVCPKFREPRIFAYNQVWRVINTFPSPKHRSQMEFV